MYYCSLAESGAQNGGTFTLVFLQLILLPGVLQLQPQQTLG